MICHGVFPFWSCLVGVLYASCIYMGMFFFSLGDLFFYDLVKDLVSAIDLVFLSFIYANNLKVWSFDGDSHFLHVAFFSFLNVLFLCIFYLDPLLYLQVLILYLLLDSFHL